MKSLAKRAAAACLALMMAIGAYTAAAPVGYFGSAGVVKANANETEILPGDPTEGDEEEEEKDAFTRDEYYDMLFDLHKGYVWELEASMVQAGDPTSNSMSNNAINHTVWLEMIDDQLYITVKFTPLEFLGQTGYLGKLSYYNKGYSKNARGALTGTVSEAEVLSEYDVQDAFNKDTGENYPKYLRFPLVDGVAASSEDSSQLVPLQVYVPVMASINPSSGTQSVYMKLDWKTAEHSSSKNYVNDDTFTELPFVPAGSGSSSSSKQDINGPYRTDDIEQLADGRYHIKGSLATTYGSAAESLFGEDMEVIVRNGEYYLLFDIIDQYTDPIYGKHYIPGVYYYTRYSYTDSYYGTAGRRGEPVSTYDVVDDEVTRYGKNQVVDLITGEKEDYKYPKRYGIPLAFKKQTNSKEYIPIDLSRMVYDSSKDKYKMKRSAQRFILLDWTTAELFESWSSEDADYTLVDAAIAKVPKDLSGYTEESVKAVSDAVNAVVRDLSADRQSEVAEMAKAINDAVAALKYKPADYSKVDEALAAVPEDLSGYTDETVKAINDAVAAVERDLDITDQSKVDAMAKAINDAVAALEKKSETKRLNGDVDNTGKVDTKDAMKIIAFAKKTHAPKDDEEFKYADVNHDGVIDSKDAMMVVAHVKGTKKLPA